MLSKGLHWLATVSSLMRLLMIMPAMLLGCERSVGLFETPKLRQGVDGSRESTESRQSSQDGIVDLQIFIFDAQYILGDCQNWSKWFRPGFRPE